MCLFPTANSGEFLADSSTSFGHDNIGVSHKYEKVSLDDVDVEIDGPTEDHTPHHELDNLNSSGPGRQTRYERLSPFHAASIANWIFHGKTKGEIPWR